MQIEYVATRSKRTVPDHIGQALIARKLARRVYQTRQMKAEQDSDVVESLSTADDIEISPRTGKPKRQYKRRDLTAED